VPLAAPRVPQEAEGDQLKEGLSLHMELSKLHVRSWCHVPQPKVMADADVPPRQLKVPDFKWLAALLQSACPSYLGHWGVPRHPKKQSLPCRGGHDRRWLSPALGCERRLCLLSKQTVASCCVRAAVPKRRLGGQQQLRVWVQC
jgi:hypothetical protein